MAGFSTSILVIKNVQMKIELFKNLYKWFLGCRIMRRKNGILIWSLFWQYVKYVFSEPVDEGKTYFFNKSISTEIDLNEKP